MKSTDYNGLKIYGFEFPNYTDNMMWWPPMAKRIGEIGTIIATSPNSARVWFVDDTEWIYPISLIEQHLVPESGGEKDYTPIDFDRLPELQKEIYFDKARGILSGLHCCTRVWEAWQYGTMDQDDFVVADESDELVYQTARRLHDQVEESRAQDFVNAEAYRVENERLRKFIETIEAAATLSVTMGVPLDAKLIMENVNHTKSYLK